MSIVVWAAIRRAGGPQQATAAATWQPLPYADGAAAVKALKDPAQAAALQRRWYRQSKDHLAEAVRLAEAA